jgi:CBS domain-containing protein
MLKYQIPIASTIRDAMKCIDENSTGACIIHDATFSVIALVTDGDIRRALLLGVSLESSVIEIANTNFVFVDSCDDFKSSVDAAALGYSFIPVLDFNRQLVDIISLHREIRFPICT